MGSDSTAVAAEITDRTPSGHLVPDKVRAARCEMPDVATLGDLAETSKVLSHPTRLKIIHALFRNELCVDDLATQPAHSISATAKRDTVVAAPWEVREEIVTVRLLPHVLEPGLEEQVYVLLVQTVEGQLAGTPALHKAHTSE